MWRAIRLRLLYLTSMEYVKLAVTHPSELRSLITYKVWRDPVHDFRRNPEASGFDRERMRACWSFLDATSRSFAAVIKELKGELSRVICIFYLVLRGLDTCLLYTSPSPRDKRQSRMPSSA